MHNLAFIGSTWEAKVVPMSVNLYTFLMAVKIYEN